MSRDPNRYAEGLDAAALRARLDDQQLALDVLAGKYQRAEHAHSQTFSFFKRIEEQYLLYQGLLQDAAAYVSQSKLEYDAQLASITATRAFFHPVRKAPLDVLGHIFELCLTDLPYEDPLLDARAASSLTRQQQPFRLAAVCRRWREASLAHPRAWGLLELAFDAVTEENISRWVGFANAVLSRARSAPIDLCLTRSLESLRCHARLVRTLVPAMSRCARAYLTLDNLSSGDALLPILTSKTPKLRQAYVVFGVRGDSNVLSVVQPFPHAPMLQYLHADEVYHRSPVDVSFPRLKSARIANIDCTSDSDVLGCLLQAMPVLEELRILWPEVELAGFNGLPLELPRCLRSLYLHVTDDCPVEQLLLRFNFSAVTTLTLFGDPPSTERRLQFLSGLPKLDHIVALNISDVGGLLFRLLLDRLNSLSNLESLSIDCSDITCGNIVELVAFLCPQSPPADWPCRKLEGIRFQTSCDFAEDCNMAAFLDIINLRASAHAEADVNTPCKLNWLRFANSETANRGSIQERVDHAIEAAS